MLNIDVVISQLNSKFLWQGIPYISKKTYSTVVLLHELIMKSRVNTGTLIKQYIDKTVDNFLKKKTPRPSHPSWPKYFMSRRRVSISPSIIYVHFFCCRMVEEITVAITVLTSRLEENNFKKI